jgi:hypothetical protein
MASTLPILRYTLPDGRSGLSSQEVIAVCRQAFRKRVCLPEAIRTDNATCFVSPEASAFPTNFILYLWGLAVEHQTIAVRRPSQNGGIERDQRTFSEHFLDYYKFASQKKLQKDVDAFGHFQSHFVPSRSVSCCGKTASQVAKQLPCKARSYKPRLESKIFNLENIYQKLSTLTWDRTGTEKKNLEVIRLGLRLL